MIQLNVANETSRLKAVVLGIAQSNGPTPTPAACYDPSSLMHVKAGTYPLEPQMLKELSALEAVFKRYNVTVFRPHIIPDCNQIFARDVAFVIEDKIIKSNILPDRENEFSAMSHILEQIDSRKIIELPEECHIEGGDVILFNDYLFAGVYTGPDYSDFITARTNQKAIDALKSLFPHKTLKTFELKKSNTEPQENALHLDCCFQPIGKGKALIHKAGFLNPLDCQFLENLFGKENLFQASKNEMAAMNCNVFSISEDVVVSEQNFIRLNQWLRLQGFIVEEVAYSEISKQGGLFRCSTMPLIRT
ncbi:MAG TPA: amidinotransferase [Flavobacteriaceae bacterium]|nr:amidinotransferase [Flavobacteriaceae bacterium]